MSKEQQQQKNSNSNQTSKAGQSESNKNSGSSSKKNKGGASVPAITGGANNPTFKDKMKLQISVTDNDDESESDMSSGIGIVTIYNGFCRFNPSTSRGKWIFVGQTMILSFTPLFILLIQNSFNFKDMLYKREGNLVKNRMVDEVASLTEFITALQTERVTVAQGLFISMSSGEKANLTKEFKETDATILKVTWSRFGPQKLFDTKLRFQIRLDDFRGYLVRSIEDRTADEQTIEEVLSFYNMATITILNFLATEIGKASSSNTWRLIMTAFNTIKIVESAGIGLVFGLRYYGNGVLKEREIIIYIEHHALLWEYYLKGKEIVPKYIKPVLDELYRGKAFNTLAKGAEPILSNLPVEPNYKHGVTFFIECRKFISDALSLLDLLRNKIQVERHSQLYSLKLANIWSISILVIILVISALLAFLARSVIKTFQMFASNLEERARALKKQQKKQNRLVQKMLPKVVVEKIKSGEDVIETFDCASIFFSSVIGFSEMVTKCTAFQVVQFLNDLYTVMDDCMDEFDVYKVETISDSYLVASGLPKKNGDRHAVEICSMALKIRDTSSVVIRPDKKPMTIELKAGIHTGSVVAGIVGNKLPRYCLFGDTVNTASRMQSQSLPGKIQISSETKLFLDVVGGFSYQERGTIDVKGKGPLQTYWLKGM